MIKSVTVTNPKGESLMLEFQHPESSGLAVRKIEGLGPPKANINTSELATVDGAAFNSARTTMRNIVLDLVMFPQPVFVTAARKDAERLSQVVVEETENLAGGVTLRIDGVSSLSQGSSFGMQVESIRQRTYRYFPLKKKVKLFFETDNRAVEIEGYVESNEPDIFSSQESTRISILCPDPYFYEEKMEETAFMGVRPAFEFPLENPSLTEDLIEFGEIRLDTRANLYYEGDVDTGVIITIHATGPATDITLYNTVTRETMTIDTEKIEALTGQAFDQGDDIIISTVKNAKSVQLLRDGSYTNVIAALKRDSDWFQISAGDNEFEFVAETGVRNLMVTFTYRNAYGGI